MRLTLATLLILFAYPVMSQPTCAPHAKVMEHLGQKYGEAIVAQGIDARGALVEVTASEDGGWTIIVTAPSGVSCVVATGKAWETVSPVKGEQS